MSLRKRIETRRNMSFEERIAYYEKKEHDPSTIYYRMAKRGKAHSQLLKRLRDMERKNRSEQITLAIAALSTLFFTLGSILISSYLYLN